jgi:hypothetical protein
MNEETKTRSTATTIVRTDPLRFKKGVDGTVILLQIQDIPNTVLATVFVRKIVLFKASIPCKTEFNVSKGLNCLFGYPVRSPTLRVLNGKIARDY